MEFQNYRREFLYSAHHAYMGLATLGVGAVSGNVFGLMLGALAYTIGWIYLPDSGFFKKSIDDKTAAIKKKEDDIKIEDFRKKQTKVLNSLEQRHLIKYKKLREICLEIERVFGDSGTEAQGLRLGSLDKLMWAYLRLLGMQEMLEKFMSTESSTSLDEQREEITNELYDLRIQLNELKENREVLPSLLETKERVIKSKQDRLDALQQRKERMEQAKSNLAYVVAEQERLHEEILLMRSDVMASRDAQSLSLKIDATVDHIDEANKIMRQFEGILELSDDVPMIGESRIGYGEVNSKNTDDFIEKSVTRPKREKEKN